MSKQLIRTNPRLSGNVKFVIDSSNQIYLDYIDSQIGFSRKLVNPTSALEKDLADFASKKSQLLYKVLDTVDGESLYHHRSFRNNYGSLGSELSIFAPIWIENRLPQYFIVFTTDNNNESTIHKVYKLSDYFHNYTSKIKSDVINVDYDNNVLGFYGININDGVITKSTEYWNPFINEQPIIKTDDYVLDGFRRNLLLCCNLLNLEFLFTPTTDEYRGYYGRYCDEIKVADFLPESEVWYNKNIEDGWNVKKITDKIDVRRGSSRGSWISDLENTIPVVKFGDNFIKIKSITKSVIELNDSIAVSEINKFDDTVQISAKSSGIIKDMAVITVTDEHETGATITIMFKKKKVGYVMADTLPKIHEHVEGIGTYFYYHPNGTKTQIASAMAQAFRYTIKKYKLPIDVVLVDENVYLYAPVDSGYTLHFNHLYKDYDKLSFNGSRFGVIVDNDTDISGYTHLKTESGYTRIKSVNPDLDNPSQKLVLTYSPPRINNGYVSATKVSRINLSYIAVSEISDFDFDVIESDYGRTYDSIIKRYFGCANGQLQKDVTYKVLKNDIDIDVQIIHNGNTYYHNDEFTATSSSFDIVNGNPVLIDIRYLNDEELKRFQGFGGLDILPQTLPQILPNQLYNLLLPKNEYSGNELSESDLIQPTNVKFSKVGIDVRGNNYRFNISSIFSYNNFTPSFTDVQQNPKAFTHEWLNISGMPNIGFEDITDSYFIIGKSFDINRFRSNDTDYFSYYFTTDSYIFKDDNGDISRFKLPRIIKHYSTIRHVIDDVYECFYKGVSLQFRSNIDISNYKFSNICVSVRTKPFKINKHLITNLEVNHKYKAIVFYVEVYIDDYKTIMKSTNKSVIDYLYLYIMNSLKSYTNTGYKFGIQYELPSIPTVLLFEGETQPNNQTQTFYGYQLPTKFKDASINSIRFNDDITDFYRKDKNDEFPRIFGISETGALILSTNSGFFSTTQYLIDSESTIDKPSSDSLLLKNNNGISVFQIPLLSMSGQFSPVFITNDVYNLKNVTWFLYNGGKNVYEETAKKLSFANLIKNFENKTDFDITFVKPSEINVGGKKLLRYNGDYSIKFKTVDSATGIYSRLKFGEYKTKFKDAKNSWKDSFDDLKVVSWSDIQEIWSNLYLSWKQLGNSIEFADSRSLPKSTLYLDANIKINDTFSYWGYDGARINVDAFYNKGVKEGGRVFSGKFIGEKSIIDNVLPIFESIEFGTRNRFVISTSTLYEHLKQKYTAVPESVITEFAKYYQISNVIVYAKPSQEFGIDNDIDKNLYKAVNFEFNKATLEITLIPNFTAVYNIILTFRN